MNNRTKRLLMLLEDGGRKTVSGVPPLTYKAIEGTLKNYRIYGNTVDGESVGDRTANLFANLWEKGYIRADNGREEQIDGFICSGFFPVEYGQTYSISRNINVGYDNIRGYRDDGSFIGAGTDICDVGNPFPSAATNIGAFTVTNENVAFIRFNDSANDLGMKYMIVKGTYTEQTMPDYEPYGYEVPVTINNVTTNLYLPEQIKMVGDEAEHIDYREQKMHKVRKNLLPVVATSKTVTGVTFTVNVDKSVTCNGRNRGTSDIIFEFNQSGISLEIGRMYIVSGCPEGGAMVGSYVIKCYHGTSYGSSWAYDIGHGAAFPALGNGIARPQIIIPVGVTVNNLTFYPMIRTANIEDDTYEPYIENTDLDVTLPALPILSGTNILTVGTEVQPSKVEVMGKIKAVSAQPVLLSRQISEPLLFGSENGPDEPHQSAALTASPEGKPSFDVSEQLKGDDEYADDQSGYSSDENDLGDNSENTDDFGSDSEVGQESADSAGTDQ